ncbi:hypothetical protein FHX37_4627 [Haloactinospora alba]|uniref:Tail assembly chaperone n=1 Tax=Haloactinospora alba TaxID=405555 RepID=A0A543N2P8_9ACTN|nr:hypothetical protein [Haloactinospora alba]TQN26089.1 hypothetical protein FHX37_4627 [Haloactinospora alba]
MDVEESLQRASEIQADQESDQPQTSEHESFDAFWAEVESAREPEYETILGVTVKAPDSRDMTLQFKREMSQMDIQNVSEEEAQRLVAKLFGDHALESWVDAGMSEEQFGVVVAWGIARASGTKMTWREAYTAVVEGKAPERLKPNPKNPTSNHASGNTGGRSKGGSRRRGGRRKK